MSRFRNLSIEELLDERERLLPGNGDERFSTLHDFLAVSEELLRKIQADPDNEYEASLSYIRRSIVSNLVNYGTYLKTEYRQDDFGAERSLKRALRYEPKHPLAHYRLGFLAYQQKSYTTAIVHLQNAITCQEAAVAEYKLTAQQLFNAQFYLTNSALHLAQKTHQNMQRAAHTHLAHIPQLETAYIYDVLEKREQYVEAHAFKIIDRSGTKTCSRKQYKELLEKDWPDTMILDFTDDTVTLSYNEAIEDLPIRRAQVLAHLLQHTNERRPARRNHFRAYIESPTLDGNVSAEAFRQVLKRVRDHLKRCGIADPKELLVSKRDETEQVYYFSSHIPFIIARKND